MNKELKKEIVSYMFNNSTDFQLVNNTIHNFKNYIYDNKGNYIIGGSNVSDFILLTEKIVKF